MQPIELATKDPEPSAIAMVSGWGVTGVDAALPKKLQALQVPIVDRERCRQRYGDNITESMLCAGIEKSKGFCSGDSGGPLVAEGKLVGVVSFSRGCALPGTPGVYADVPALRDFIISNTDLE